MQPEPRRHRVLVVDDNLDTVQSMALLLRDMGHEVDFAINGHAAMEVARRFRPDVVLMDIGLPDANGLDIARKLKNEPGGKRMRIMAITGRTGTVDALRSYDAGCEEHLLKPLDPQVIESLLA
jgi:CheY-like chemotaxis protein